MHARAETHGVPLTTLTVKHWHRILDGAERGGTGLGLAIVRAIVEAHSGSAECAAVGPPHVEFRIRLPAALL